MNLVWQATLVTVAASAGLALVACTSTPTVTSAPPGASATTAATASPAISPVASPTASSPSPSAPPGPTLTKSQFADLLATGKIGDRDAKLSLRSNSGASDPDGEGEEDEQQSEARSCVKMWKLAAARLVAQASDDDQTAVVQVFSSPAAANELFALNRTCADEQAKYSPSTAVKSVSSGSQGSAQWWLTKDPLASYQATIAYGNLLAFVMVDADTNPAALTSAFVAQVDEAAEG